MVRVILGLKQADHINMSEVRKKIGMFSVNQMAVYHTVMEAYNITNKSASEQLQKNIQREVQQIMTCTYQKTPENGVQVSPILDQNCTI